AGRHRRWNAERRNLPDARQQDRRPGSGRADDRYRDGSRKLLCGGVRRRQSGRVRQLHGHGPALMIHRALFAMLCVVAVSACNNNSPSGTVSAPTTTRTTDTFSGTVQIGSSAFHSFPVSQSGTTDVTLTTTSPLATVVMGLAVGTTGDGACNPLAGASTNVVA